MTSETFTSSQEISSHRIIHRVGVAGSGMMGTQLAAYFLSRNLEVTVLTRTPDLANTRLKEFIEKRHITLGNVIDSGKLKITTNIEDLRQSEIIIEAITEDLSLKRQLIREILDTKSSPIIGSCTSSFTLGQLSSGLRDNGAIQVIHFSNPVAKMKAIELVLSSRVTEQTKKYLNDFFAQLEHKVVEVPDIPGYVINSIIFAMIDKANYLKREYEVSCENIDDLMKLGCGFPMGPFEIENLIGARTVNLIQKNLRGENSE